MEKALEILLDSAVLQETELVAFQDARHRVLAQNVVADMNMPPFDKSAVDGYACQLLDLKNELEIIEVIAAGQIPQKRLGANQCSQIMTGAMLPEGANCVIMVEKTMQTSENRILFIGDNTKTNVSYKAEDISKGETVIERGSLIKAPHIAVMAAMGAVKVHVYKKVKIGIISTGDELVEPDQKPSPSKIRNSNAYQLLAQAQNMGINAVYLGIAPDDEEQTYQMITKGMAENDLLLLTGGISMGRFDFVPHIMLKAGVDIKFQKIAVQPGRPTIYGTKGDKRVIGLPGNPVSSFTQFELLVKPFVCKMMGHDYRPLNIQLPLAENYTRRKAEVLSWFPVKINEAGEVVPLSYHGSAHISGLTFAHGISCIEAGKTELKKGERVHVRLI